jgi:hypothetical protein
LADHDIQEYRVIADIDKRLGYRARQIAKAGAFAPDKNARLTNRFRCHAIDLSSPTKASANAVRELSG